MQDNAHVTQDELARTLQLSVKTIEKHIKNLKTVGVIRRVGGDNGGYWEIMS